MVFVLKEALGTNFLRFQTSCPFFARKFIRHVILVIEGYRSSVEGLKLHHGRKVIKEDKRNVTQLQPTLSVTLLLFEVNFDMGIVWLLFLQTC